MIYPESYYQRHSPCIFLDEHNSKIQFPCRRIINLRCISAIYADLDTTKVQDTHFWPSLQPPARLSLPSFPFLSVSLLMADESGTFYQKCALQIAISQNHAVYYLQRYTFSKYETSFSPFFFSIQVFSVKQRHLLEQKHRGDWRAAIREIRIGKRRDRVYGKND